MRGIKGTIDMPLVGLGTWQYNDSTTEASVLKAFDIGERSSKVACINLPAIGFRHVDTAFGYENQVGVGRALKTLGLPRSEYFVTSKIPGGLNASATEATLELGMKQLGLE